MEVSGAADLSAKVDLWVADFTETMMRSILIPTLLFTFFHISLSLRSILAHKPAAIAMKTMERDSDSLLDLASLSVLLFSIAFKRFGLSRLQQLKHLTRQRASSRRITPLLIVAVEKASDFFGGWLKAPEWKRMSSKELGISTSKIAKPTKIVLNGLKRHGFEVYLVGGCVRDLVLNQTPKDFDIITSAELKQVMRVFSRCRIVGRRFPICHVYIEDEFVEVSSFSTSARNFGRSTHFSSEIPLETDEEDYIRWKNCLERDFTINGLMFDPYARLIYDYMGGLEDIRRAKVQTIGPARDSFLQDCARILRAIRIAARLGFRFTRETARCIKELSGSIRRLDKARLLMELNYMLAYGSAEPSLRLLWKYGLLEILLPIQAAYLVQQGFKRRDKRSNMLLSLFSNLDKLLTPDRPCHSCLWVALLAFHKALFEKPREPLVVAAFSLAVHNGGDVQEALNIAKQISVPHETGFCELSEPQNLDFQALNNEVVSLASSIQRALSNITDEHHVSQAMSMYPKAPYSDLVFIPLTVSIRVSQMFDCVKAGKANSFTAKQGSKIDYEALSLGSLPEVRHVFARTVFDTVFPLNLSPRSQS